MGDGITSLRHYLRESVASEIARFCRNRWVALETAQRGGKRIFYRYWSDGRPLTISTPSDVKRIINRFGKKIPRTIYATANIYRGLESKDDLREENILRTTPSWDIDGSLEEMELIKEAARILLERLRDHGIEKSIYLIWSGRGIHIHLNEGAISDEIWRRGAVQVSYAIVEYVLREARGELLKICAKSKQLERSLKVENVMDVQRVFTAPLSLHRELDLVAVTIDPEKLGDFDLSWTNPSNFRYWERWYEYSSGEADELAEKAVNRIKDKSRIVIIEAARRGDRRPSRVRPIGRFQVMALLQAARYFVLKGDLEKAKSFGLNRAIFYAWAKRRGVRGRRVSKVEGRGVGVARGMREHIGDELAFRNEKGLFIIGGQVQRPIDFDRQVAARFGDENDFNKFWEAAIKYVRKFPREILENQREFYKRVYLPIRDNVEKLLES